LIAFNSWSGANGLSKCAAKPAEIGQGSRRTISDELRKDEQAKVDALSEALPPAVASAMMAAWAIAVERGERHSKRAVKKVNHSFQRLLSGSRKRKDLLQHSDTRTTSSPNNSTFARLNKTLAFSALMPS